MNDETKVHEYTITFTAQEGSPHADITVAGFPEGDLPEDAAAKSCLRVMELMTVSGMVSAEQDEPLKKGE